MAERRTLLLALAYLGGLAWLAYEWQRPLALPDAADHAPALDQRPVRPPHNPMASRSSFDEIVRRPLFSADRRPVETGAAAPAAAAPAAPRQAAAELTSIRLSAILVDAKNLTALVEHGDGQATTVRKGAELVGWQVEDIQDDHIVLTLRGQRRELFVHQFDAPPPLRPAAASSSDRDGRTRARPLAANRTAPRPAQARRR